MTSPTTVRRSRFLSLLQVLVAICVIAFHAQVPRAPSTAAGIELFFLIAGINMARHFDRYDRVLSYAWSRARRMGPHVAVIWLLALGLFVSVAPTRDFILFLVAAPLFCQNLISQFFHFHECPYVSRVFVMTLWFVAALFQLQVFLFAVRRLFTTIRPLTLVCGTLAFNVLFTLGVAMLLGAATATIPAGSADLIYRLPFTHLASATLGLMLGRGLLRGIGRLFPVLLAIAAAAGIWTIVSTDTVILRGSLGFPALMFSNYQYLWGYPLLALTLVSMCDPDGFVARSVEAIRLRPALDRLAGILAALSYGAYAFHGVFLTAGVWISWKMGWTYNPVVLFVTVTVAAFVSALQFERLTAWLRRSSAERRLPVPSRMAEPV